MAESFAAQFGTKIHLAAGLAHFNPPARLDSFIRDNLPLSEQSVRAKLVVAMLRHQMLMQLHKFYYLMMPYSNASQPEPNEKCPEEFQKLIATCPDLANVQRAVENICADLLENNTYASVERKLTLLVKAAPMMNGNHHLEDIKYKNNMVCGN